MPQDPLGILTAPKTTSQVADDTGDPLGILKKKSGSNIGGTPSDIGSFNSAPIQKPAGIISNEQVNVANQQLQSAKNNSAEQQGVAEYGSKVHKAQTDNLYKAAVNTVNKQFGQNLPANKDQIINNLMSGVGNGDLGITQDAEGSNVIKNSGNFFQSFKAAADQAQAQNIEDSYLRSANKNEAIGYLNRVQQHPETGIVKEMDIAPSGLGAGLGSQAALLGKGIIGSMAGAETGLTGGASVGSFLNIASDLANGGYSQALKRNYYTLKQQGLSDNDAFDKATHAALTGEAVNLATGAVLSGETNLLPKPTIATDGFVNSLKHTITSAPKVLGSSAAGAVINDIRTNALSNGNVIDGKQMLSDAADAVAQMAVMHFGLGALGAIVNGQKTIVPSPARPQIENIVASADRNQVSDYYTTMEQQGTFPEGTTQKVLDKLKQFDEQKKVVNDMPLSEEQKASITGKLIQRQDLVDKTKELKKYGGSFENAVQKNEDAIAGLDDDVNKIISTHAPYKFETDANTGERAQDVGGRPTKEEAAQTEIPNEQTNEVAQPEQQQTNEGQPKQENVGENLQSEPSSSNTENNSNLAEQTPLIKDNSVVNEDAIRNQLKEDGYNADKIMNGSEDKMDNPEFKEMVDLSLKLHDHAGNLKKGVNKNELLRFEQLREKFPKTNFVLKPNDETLLPLLENEDVYIRREVADYNGATENALLKAVKQKSFPFEVALRAVRNKNATESVLKAALNHPESEVRYAAQEKLDAQKPKSDNSVVEDKPDDFSFLKDLTDKQLDKRLNIVRQQQDILSKKIQNKEPVNDRAVEQLHNQETAIINENLRRTEPQQNISSPINTEQNGKETKAQTKAGHDVENKGGKPPIDEPPLDESGANKNTVGVSHASLTDLAQRLGLKEPERGGFASPQELADRGRQLLKAGADPKEVDNPSNELHDRIAIARAHLENLVAAQNKAGDESGLNSKEYEKAQNEADRYANDVVKKLGNQAHKAFQSLQGEIDLDTGSFTAIKRAKGEATGRPQTELPKEIQDLSAKVKNLESKTKELQKQLQDALDKAATQEKPNGKNIASTAKKVADALRKGKLSRPDTFSAATPASLVWDSAIEIAAKTIETGGKVAQAISDAVEHIKESDWYKGLNADKQKQAEQSFKDSLNDFYKETAKSTQDDLASQFAGKKDNVFSIDDTKNIWQYAKETYINDNPNFKVVDMVNNVALDLGLTPEQIRNALAGKVETKRITDQIYRNQYERNKASKTIRNWVDKSNNDSVNNLFSTIASPFRSLATLGHGHALLFTHAGLNLFDPQIFKKYLLLAGKQFKIVYGKEENYQKAVNDFQNDPLYTTALRAGVAIDPNSVYDDWQLANTFLKRLKIQGNKGFLMLKLIRLEIFKNEYNKLSATEKADPNVIKNIAKITNHWTGTAGIKVSPNANAFIFAPNLIVSKFARLTTDPIKALGTLSQQILKKEVLPEDAAASKVILMKTGRILATYAGALLANQALLKLTGSAQSVNFSHPTKGDWLKFKTGDATADKTVDVSGGMVGTMKFLTNLGALPFTAEKDIPEEYYGNKTAKDAAQEEVTGFLRNMLSPFGGTAADFIFHKDFAGNVLPVYNDKVKAGKEKLSWVNYAMEKIPIPLADAYKTIHEQMINSGTPTSTAKAVVGGLIIGAIASSGIKIGNASKDRPTPFTDEDKKDPTFKYFTDNGFNLPNTALSSEVVTDEDKKTKKAISDYPKNIQDKYQQVHKEELKNELKSIQDNGVVYVKNYKDGKGNDKSSVVLDNPYDDDYKEVPLDKIIKRKDNYAITIVAKVLSRAQRNATVSAKEKVFGNENENDTIDDLNQNDNQNQ